MIFNPAIIALLTGSLLTAGFGIYAAAIGTRVLRDWDLQSGSDQQLWLERKTYLVSTILTYLMVFELLSLFLFVYTADDIHKLFVGAMCAAGSLNVNAYGYPTLVLKIVNFVVCGIWLIVNYTDNQGYDYPLIRSKYKLLLAVTALLVLETYLQTGYFRNLRADVITSCCGALFSEDAPSVAGVIAGLPSLPAKVLFFLSGVLTLRVGVQFLVTGRAAAVYSLLSTWLLVMSLAAVISFISLYFYELPTHHCPFCLLQKEYNYIGYPLYLSLFLAGITGGAVGVIERFKQRASLRAVVPVLQKRLCMSSLLGYTVFTLISVYPMLFSDFRLEGY